VVNDMDMITGVIQGCGVLWLNCKILELSPSNKLQYNTLIAIIVAEMDLPDAEEQQLVRNQLNEKWAGKR
jgi:hypothetical protein